MRADDHALSTESFTCRPILSVPTYTKMEAREEREKGELTLRWIGYRPVDWPVAHLLLHIASVGNELLLMGISH